ncbi:MAG: universal stress protein [Acidobacteria bacterium]|nr:universal stress protein [Acidobacteriota bacterium]
MTGPIVCGIDFSDHSRRALAWARFFSAQLQRPLVVVHAVEPVLAEASKVTYGPGALEATLEPELREFIGPDASTLHIGVGEPGSVLKGAAMEHSASLVVVGTQGLGRAARMWFGSTTLQLLRETTIPILAIPPQSSDAPALSGFVVGTDFSEASNAAVRTAIQLGAQLHVPVTCLHAVRNVSAHTRWNDVVHETVGRAIQAARQRLADSVGTMNNAATLTTDVRTGDAADTLIDAAKGTDVVLVVGLGGEHTGQHPGTTAYRVLSGADAPVLAVPARRA